MRALLTIPIFIVFLIVPQIASALDITEDPEKKWETTVSVGYMNFQESGINDSASLGLRLQRRITYPLLLGIGAEGSLISDVVYVNVNVPITVRIGAGPLKLDLIASPGVAYAQNTDLDISKIVGVGTVGIELKKFIKKGMSIGIGCSYSLLTYSKLNNFKAVFVISF